MAFAFTRDKVNYPSVCWMKAVLVGHSTKSVKLDASVSPNWHRGLHQRIAWFVNKWLSRHPRYRASIIYTAFSFLLFIGRWLRDQFYPYSGYHEPMVT